MPPHAERRAAPRWFCAGAAPNLLLVANPALRQAVYEALVRRALAASPPLSRGAAAEAVGATLCDGGGDAAAALSSSPPLCRGRGRVAAEVREGSDEEEEGPPGGAAELAALGFHERQPLLASAAAAVATFVATVATHPLQWYRARLQAGGAGAAAPAPSSHTPPTGSCFDGLGIKLLHTVLSNVMMYMTKEQLTIYVMRMMQSR